MIIVLGSVNLDISFTVSRLPGPGETVLAKSYLTSPGGKGANQACAAAKAGAQTAFFGKVGQDSFASTALAGMADAGVDLHGVSAAKAGTGCATIAVDAQAENAIVVGSAANLEVTHDQVPDELLSEPSMLLLQMEIPYGENWRIIERARQKGCKVLLNVAPYGDVPRTALEGVDILIVNETEARQLAGSKTVNLESLARELSERHNLTTVMTLGSAGVLSTGPAGLLRVPTHAVEAVDTTGAGDTFCGCLAAAMDQGEDLPAALAFANAGAALACTRAGAQTAQPNRSEILSLLSD
ncbi:MAG: ribokinase [Pseudomonadota bacterium]